MRGRQLVAVTVSVFALLVVACDSENGGEATPSPSATSSSGTRTTEADVVYRSIDGIDLAMDVYGPPTTGPHPAVMLIHGGAWRSGGRKSMAQIAQVVASGGFVAFVPDYRLAPPGGRWTAPAPLEDLRAAAGWIRDNGDSYGATTERIGAIGSSAGAHLGLLLGSEAVPEEERLGAVVAWSPPTDLEALYMDPEHRANVLGYTGCHLDECPEVYAEQSPVSQVGPEHAPSLIVNGARELMPLTQSVVMARRLEAAKVPVTLRVLPGTRHAQSYAPFVMQESLEWLRTYLS